MILYDELYFEIELSGTKAELKKFVKFLKSGELDDFFDISSDYISYNDDFADADEDGKTGFVFTNDDLGIEIDEFNPEDFLDVFCKAAKHLDVVGHLYDLEDEEYSFTSAAGDPGYVNTRSIKHLDELDEEALKDDSDDEEDM